MSELCVCGHPSGDHKGAGGGFVARPVRGVCLIPNCGCTRYVRDDEQARADEWLTDTEDTAA